MTATLTVNRHEIQLDEYQPRQRREGQKSQEVWIPGDQHSCDVWLEVHPIGPGQWVAEGEVSNASFAPGVAARPTTRCKVATSVPHGWSLGHDLRELPSELDPKRAALFRILLSAPEAELIDVDALDVPLKDWQDNYGPLGVRLPRDRFVDAGDRLEEAYREGRPCEHEDAEDALTDPQQYGPLRSDNVAGSKIAYGYSWDDLRAVKVLARAVTNRGFYAYDRRTGAPITVEYYGAVTPVVDELSSELPEFAPVVADVEYARRPFDPAHRARQSSHAQIWWSMTRSRLAARQIVAQAEMDRLLISERGPTNFTPDWRPRNIHQLHELALRDPHQGLPDEAGRGFGWLAWDYSWRMLVSPRDWSRAFVRTFLSTMELGASLQHGFVQRTARTMPDGHVEQDAAQCFELALLAIPCVALARLSGAPVPQWPQLAVSRLYAMETLEYAGYPSPPHELQWQPDGSLAPAPGTDSDPAFGWLDELCAALYRASGNVNFLTFACKWHQAAPNWNVKQDLMAQFPDIQDLRETLMARGIGKLR